MMCNSEARKRQEEKDRLEALNVQIQKHLIGMIIPSSRYKDDSWLLRNIGVNNSSASTEVVLPLIKERYRLTAF